MKMKRGSWVLSILRKERIGMPKGVGGGVARALTLI